MDVVIDKSMVMIKFVAMKTLSRVVSIVLLASFNIMLLARAEAHTKHGTVVVTDLSKSDLVIAVDSRVTFDGVAHYTRDDGCKIRIANKNVVFVISQTEFDGCHDFFDIAKNLRPTVPTDSQMGIVAFANQWANAVLPFLKIDGGSPSKDNIASTGFFATKDRQGKIVLAVINILRHNGPPGQRAVLGPASVRSNDAIQGTLKMLNNTGQAVADELIAGRTQRAKSKADVLEHLNQATTLPAMERATAEFASLTADWDPTVGKPIDQIHIGKNGIEWIHHKPSCPVD